MTTKITSTGVTFDDGTSLSSKYGIIPQSSVSIFFQTAAPTGWTKSTSNNDRTLRVVTGNGGGTGGTTAFSTIFPTSTTPISVTNIPLSGSTGSTTLSASQIPGHTHPQGGVSFSPGAGDVSSAAGWTRNATTTGSGPSSGGGSHSHPWSGTGSLSTSFDLRLQYIDVIVCTFN